MTDYSQLKPIADFSFEEYFGEEIAETLQKLDEAERLAFLQIMYKTKDINQLVQKIGNDVQVVMNTGEKIRESDHVK